MEMLTMLVNVVVWMQAVLPVGSYVHVCLLCHLLCGAYFYFMCS